MELTSSLVVRALALTGLAGALASSVAVQPAAAKKAKKLDPTVSIVTEFKGPVKPGQTRTETAQCPPGNEVIGGSYAVGGDSLFAHASDAVPNPESRSFEVSVTNPPVNAFAGIPAADANIRVTAECAESGRPIVVDGRFEPAERHKEGPRDDTTSVKTKTKTGVASGDVDGAVAACPKGTSIFGGGYQTGGSPWAHITVAAVASKDNDYAATITNPPFDPALGILRQDGSVRATALCAKRGEPIVVGGLDSRRSATTAKKPKNKKHGTVKVVIEDLDGIDSGEVETEEAKCPGGYSVFGGSAVIGGNSSLAVLTEATVQSKSNSFVATVANAPANINAGIPKLDATLRVGAICAKDGRPIVVDGAFG